MKAEALPINDAGELCRLGADELAAAYRSGSLSPVAVATAAMDRAEAVNPLLNAFTFLDRRGAGAAAAASEARWRAGAPLSPLDGVPTTLKDIVWVEGWSVRYGSATTEAAPRPEDAPAVARLRSAGAVFIGQTTTPEFGWKAVTDSAAFGLTRNPFDEALTPGGSSGGAAVAAAVGAGVLHLGTDGGGSIRIPAAFTGTVGHKPTFGRVAAYPASAFGTLAHVGPIARTARDALLMLRAMSGRDRRDFSQGEGRLEALDAPPAALGGARIGVWWTPPSGRLHPDVAAVVAAALKVLSPSAASVEATGLPGEDLHDLFRRHWFTGAAARLALVPPDLRGGIDPGFLAVAAEGAAMDAASLVQAQMRRAEFGAAMDRLLERFDFLVSPATTIPPFAAGREVPEDSGLRRWTEWAAFSYPLNLSQQPACVIPCGRTEAGLPVGLQIVGARGRDAAVLAAAAEAQTLLGGGVVAGLPPRTPSGNEFPDPSFFS